VPALIWRNDPSVHKRLILLATLYIAGVAWISAVQLTALSVYTSPGWAPIAVRLLGH
jgi:hypothetical protein